MGEVAELLLSALDKTDGDVERGARAVLAAIALTVERERGSREQPAIQGFLADSMEILTAVAINKTFDHFQIEYTNLALPGKDAIGSASLDAILATLTVTGGASAGPVWDRVEWTPDTLSPMGSVLRLPSAFVPALALAAVASPGNLRERFHTHQLFSHPTLGSWALNDWWGRRAAIVKLLRRKTAGAKPGLELTEDAAGATLIRRAEDIDGLLALAADELETFHAEVADVGDPSQVTTLSRARCHGLLSKYRSVLDYLGNEIAGLCDPKPRGNIYFPVAGWLRKAGAYEQCAAFQLRIDGKPDTPEKAEFPNLAFRAPKVHRYLMWIQHWEARDTWLADFSLLTNDAKHNELPTFSARDFSRARISAGTASLTVGDMANTDTALFGAGARITFDIDIETKRIDLAEGATLVFLAPNGGQLEVRGPQVLDCSTEALARADDGIDFQRSTWRDLHLPGTHHTAADFLTVVDREVRTIYQDLTDLIHGRPLRPRIPGQARPPIDEG